MITTGGIGRLLPPPPTHAATPAPSGQPATTHSTGNVPWAGLAVLGGAAAGVLGVADAMDQRQRVQDLEASLQQTPMGRRLYQELRQYGPLAEVRLGWGGAGRFQPQQITVGRGQGFDQQKLALAHERAHELFTKSLQARGVSPNVSMLEENAATLTAYKSVPSLSQSPGRSTRLWAQKYWPLYQKEGVPLVADNWKQMAPVIRRLHGNGGVRLVESITRQLETPSAGGVGRSIGRALSVIV